nr:putative ribonuclease H-like domain-containing protein [Tanacetum cinerariifolium]
MPPRADLSFAGLDDSFFKFKVSKTITSVPKIKINASKTSKDNLEKPKIVRSSAPLIEEWESDSEDENVFKPKEVKKTVKPSLEKIKFVKARNTTVENENNAKKPKKFSQSPKDCDFYENKMVLNNKGKITRPKEVRPVWDNTARVNHQNKLTHPHPKRNCVPATFLTKSRQVPVNAAKQSAHRAAASVSIARRVNTTTSRPNVNNALPITYSYSKAHSPVKKPFNQKSATKTNNFNENVNTAKVNNVTTVGPKAVVSVVDGNRNNAVKSSACWIWRPKENLIDHISKDSGSYTLKRFKYDQEIFDRGCSRHMTGNKSYLTYYQEIDGRFVAFGGNAKRGKITGKGKIRTGKLDFEDVYFVKELKFNLFSVSQMYDKKNNVLFTDTECVVLSSDFKLLNESQVLLKVPRNNNMYSFDLRNVVPVGGLTCFFENATLDESNLWHRRLGHIKFKTINKLVRGNLMRGLPSKLFENDHTCVACQKGKQHKASCIENQMDHKVKTIIWDNKTKFKNRIMNEFCEMKGIRREFSVARTLQQNGTGPNWMFDMDTLTMSMNYQPVFTGNQTNGPKNSEDEVADDAGKKSTKVPSKENGVQDPSKKGRERTQRNKFENLLTDPFMPDLEDTTDLQDTKIFSGSYDDEVEGAVYRNRKDERGIVIRIKVRLVAQGYTQEEGIDYDKFFAPAARIEAIRLFFAYALFMGFIVYHMDVKIAFLYGTIEEEVYVCQPLGFEDPHFSNKVYKVEKVLYGLHKAHRAWYETLSTYLLANGFRKGIIDKTLFIKKDKGDILLVQVYVDDIIFGSTKKSLCIEFEGLMHKKFQMSSMRELTFFLSDEFGIKTGGCKVNTARQKLVLLSKSKAKQYDWIGCDDTKVLRTKIISHSLMATLEFCEKHNMAAYLKKPTRSEGFQEIVDFLNVDGKEFIVTEASVMRHLQLSDAEVEGKGSGQPSKPQPPSSIDPPSHEKQVTTVTSQPQKTHTPRQTKSGRDTKIPQSSGPPKKVNDEVVYIGEDDRVVRVATTVTSLEAEQESGIIHKTRSTTTLNEPSPRGTGSCSGPRCQDTTLGDADAQTRLVLKGRHIVNKINLKISWEFLVKLRYLQIQLEEMFRLILEERAVSTGSGRVSTASRMISTTEESVSTVGASMPVNTAGMIDKGSYTLKQLKKLSFDEIKELFKATMRSIKKFVPMESEDDKAVPKLTEARSSKRDVEEELDQGRSKKQKIGKSSKPKNKDVDELSKEELQQLMIIIPEQGVNVKALQTKYPIIDWIFTLKTLGSIERLLELEITLRLYDTCGVHHVSTKKGMDIYMLVEKEYPLSRAILTYMLCPKLLVERDSEMCRELIRKISMQVERPRK